MIRIFPFALCLYPFAFCDTMSTTISGTITAATTLGDRIRQIYEQPLPDLLFEAQQIHREHHNPPALNTVLTVPRVYITRADSSQNPC